jgi:hypothetical protein
MPSECLASHGSAAGTVTSYRLDDLRVEVRVPVGINIFTSPYRSDRLWGSLSLIFNGYRGAVSLGVKRPVHEVDNTSNQSRSQQKVHTMYLHLLPMRLYGVVLN